MNKIGVFFVVFFLFYLIYFVLLSIFICVVCHGDHARITIIIIADKMPS